MEVFDLTKRASGKLVINMLFLFQEDKDCQF